MKVVPCIKFSEFLEPLSQSVNFNGYIGVERLGLSEQLSKNGGKGKDEVDNGKGSKIKICRKGLYINNETTKAIIQSPIICFDPVDGCGYATHDCIGGPLFLCSRCIGV